MRPDKPKPTKSELLAELESIRYSLSEGEIEERVDRQDVDIPVLVEPVSKPGEAQEGYSLGDEVASMTLTSIDDLSEDDLIFDDSGPRARAKTTVDYHLSGDPMDEDHLGTASSENGSAVGRAQGSVIFSRTEPDSPEATITTMDEEAEYSEPSPGQQSLFEQPAPMPKGKSTRKEAAARTAESTRKEEDRTKIYSPTPDSENPFLPKHIRERLSRGRSTIMDELMLVGDSLNRDKNQFQPPPAKPDTDAPAHPTPVLHSSKQTDRIVEELVAEYLPRMEAELRKRLREQLSENTSNKIVDPETSS